MQKLVERTQSNELVWKRINPEEFMVIVGKSEVGTVGLIITPFKLFERVEHFASDRLYRSEKKDFTQEQCQLIYNAVQLQHEANK